MQALNQLAPEVGLAPACAALNLSRSSVYREDARRRLLLLPATATLVPAGTMAVAVTDGAAATVGDTAYFVGGESPNPTATVSELTVR